MAATVMYRPQSVMDYTSPYEERNPDVKLGEDILYPGFQKHLHNFYLKASSTDRLKCSQLIASLDEGETVRDQARDLGLRVPEPGRLLKQNGYYRPKRPRTAMANLEQYRDPLDVYKTTYQREYTALPSPPGQADRPSTARHQVAHDLSAPLGDSTYQTEYLTRGKPLRINPDSPDDHKRNNPHPAEGFMVWRLARDAKMDPRANWGDLTDELMDQVMRGQIASTYQKDYLGIPQGKKGQKTVKLAFGDLKDKRSDVPYTLNTSTRKTFQTPQVTQALAGNTLRYGCNKQKHISANGVVPTVSNRYLKIKPRTTYEREYNANNNCKTIRDIKEYKEKESLRRMMTNFKPHSAARSQSSSTCHVHPTRCIETPISTGPQY